MSNKSEEKFSIGKLAAMLDISVDALRYYEKIGLLTGVNRTAGGARIYNKYNISQLRFVKRAQKMGFSLDEIRNLLRMRANPREVKNDIRELTKCKLEEVEARLKELQFLRDELRLLVNFCTASSQDCPIIDKLNSGSPILGNKE